MVTFQVISYSVVSLIRRICMYLFDFIRNALVFNLISWNLPMGSFVIRCPAYISKSAKRTNRIIMDFVFFFDCLINLSLSKQAYPASSLFHCIFRNDVSISAFSNFNSSRSFSSSVRECCGFRLPRLFCNASILFFSYFTVSFHAC